MNLRFLTPAGTAPAGGDTPVARSPMEAAARAAGARYEVRDGWSVAVDFGSTAQQEATAAAETVGWADVSHLGKLEVQATPAELESIASACGAALELGEAVRHADAWWCRMTAVRALVIGDLGPVRERIEAAAAGSERASVLDVTSAFAAITLTGPLAREVFARFSALDLRPERAPVHALRPGSIGRQPGILIREAEDRYLFLFGWATGEYMWSVVTDAGRHLGGRPIGAQALTVLGAGELSEETVGA
jgi:heterotetrameric sarcosine oxidase gamma subunit